MFSDFQPLRCMKFFPGVIVYKKRVPVTSWELRALIFKKRNRTVRENPAWERRSKKVVTRTCILGSNSTTGHNSTCVCARSRAATSLTDSMPEC